MEMIIEKQVSSCKKGFHCAEFKLNQPRILYQFRIRKSSTEPLYAVLKEGSKALGSINEGDVISMRYYSLDKTIPAESLNTRIKYITKGGSAGFRNHYVVGLHIEDEKELNVA